MPFTIQCCLSHDTHVMLKSSNNNVSQEMLRISDISFLSFPFFLSALSCSITLSEDDVQCAAVLPAKFSDGYYTGADYENQFFLLWNLKEVKRPEANSAFTSVTIQSYARKLTFLSIDCVHLPQQSAFIDNYLLVLNQSYVKHRALLSGRVNNIDSILKWIRHRRN